MIHVSYKDFEINFHKLKGKIVRLHNDLSEINVVLNYSYFVPVEDSCTEILIGYIMNRKNTELRDRTVIIYGREKTGVDNYTPLRNKLIHIQLGD